ncbi:VOC family protein [Streptomyces sp. NBC_01498]|uniref:VOC family protein n=1 Tax=Streptomyces sp. NBC_01498 TaxID=2975870 RepID=UPI002E7B1DC8|nr:VOC family protein [Streptomyces sp. NBC_01498]WTL23699.1 VOC family protein [Streptomyces sp. NBC_01498]
MLTTRFVPGSPNWTDLATPDIEGAKTFYQGVLGWNHVSAGPQFGGYGMFQSDGKTVAGAMQLPADQAPPSWTLYFQTADSEATSAAVKDHGGRVVAEPMDVEDLGRMTLCADPSGAGFATWQPGTNTGLEATDDPGALCWAELTSPDTGAAVTFYGSVFDWGTTSMPMPGGGGDYVMVHPTEKGPDGMFAGIVPASDASAAAPTGPGWLLYFGTADCDAAVAKADQLGGTIVQEPTDIEGVGRFAVLADPYGARFALMQGASQDG